MISSRSSAASKRHVFAIAQGAQCTKFCKLSAATLHVGRVKQGTPSVHPIAGDELRALRRLQREQEPKSPFVFTSERGTPFATAGFARMVERAAIEAGLGFKVH